MDLIYFGTLIVIYYTVHSVFAGDQVKRFLTKYLISSRYYRLFYNFFSVAFLIPVLYSYFTINKDLVFISTLWNEVPGIVFLIVSSVLILFALKQYNLSEFSGFSYLKGETIHQKGKLNTSGLNAYVRHPLYFASLIFFWSLFLLLPNTPILVLAVISTFYLIAGTKLEERKLIKVFGKEYIDYQKRVPMLLPKIF